MDIGKGVAQPPPLHAAVEPFSLLDRVESLGPEASGALHIGEAGIVLVEGGKICWAVATSEQVRLRPILLRHCNQPLDTETFDAIYASCQADRTPIGERLVERGLISTDGLRQAILRHTIEGLRIICRHDAPAIRWQEHRNRRYDSRFTFAPVEIMSAIAEQTDPALAARASSTLSWHLEEEGSGIAFLRSEHAARPTPIAAIGGERFGVQGVFGLGTWAVGALDMAHAFSSEQSLVTVSWGASGSLVAFEDGLLTYVIVCDTPSSQAFVLARYVRPRSETTS